jgi:phospholipase C
METVFNRLETVKQEWRIYFHDIPQAAALARLWGRALTNFRRYETDFARDAAAGALPAYSFIEPRYFADTLGGKMPNDEHPPHDVGYGEALIASVYNAVRGGSGWKETLLMILWDEHGGCFDHVPPPRATPPDGFKPDGFDFGAFGVRVPAVIVSPYVHAGSVIRPSGVLPFDHTSIIATLRKLFGFASLTARDAAAPDLLQALGTTPDNDGPASIAAPSVPTERADVAREAMKPPNSMQRSLSAAAVQLPTAGANIGAHIERLASVPDAVPSHATVADAAGAIAAHMKAFLGRL